MLSRVLAALVVMVLPLLADAAGMLRFLDDGLRETRMRLVPRQPTGKIVLVDIDSKSIADMGAWPWPRTVHADLIDSLMGLGAAVVAFDVDFSAPSTPAADAEMAAALDRAGGSVVLASFAQRLAGDPDAPIVVNRPIPTFAERAWIASVNVRPDPDGVVRRYGFGSIMDGEAVPSLGLVLAESQGETGADFLLDMSIAADRIDRIPVVDVLAGRVPADRIAGKTVLVAAQATELRDFFTAPAVGVISGGLLQIIAAETLLQGRALVETGPRVLYAGLLLAGLAILLVGRIRWTRLLALTVLAAVGIEIAAAALQAVAPVAVATAPWHAALVLFAAGTVMMEVRLQTVLGALFSARALRAETVLGRVIDDSFAGILVIEADGRIRTASRVASAVLGDSTILAGARATEVLPKALADVVDTVFLQATAGGEGRCTGEAVIHDRHRRRRILEYVVTLSWVGESQRRGGRGPDDRPVVCLTFSDVTDRRAAELRIAHLARFDTLTDLANRNQLLERVDRELAGIAAGAPPSALLRFDLDGFRKVNDALGHELGDEVIREIGRRAGDLLPDGALLARLWADDFAVVVSGPSAAADARILAEAILEIAGEEMALKGHHVTLGASVGLVEAIEAGSADHILACGDVALGRAKDRGGKAIVVFEPEMLSAVAARQKLERDLWRALHGEQFEVLYQPQVTLADGRLIGTEALLRWQHPTRGNVSPAEFVPVAEAVGLIEPLGRWVLERACRDALSWPPHVKVAVNVSSTQFVRCDVVAMVRESLAKTGLPASRLEIEITESLFMDLSYGIGETLVRIHEMGVGIALDDFGTGFSSLGYIHRFPIDKIKIDRSFVTGLPRDRDSAAIVTAVATLAGSLGMRVIAEGIELDEQADWLKDIGIAEGQGYLYGRAKSASAIAALTAEPPAVATMAADRVA